MPEKDVLVTADWVEDHLDEFQSDDDAYRLVEINNPTVTDDSTYTSYEEGHVPGAIFLDWEEDLSDETERDIASKDKFERVNSEAGISEDSTVVVYGGGRVPNWFALFGYWEYKYYGHDDVRVIDGGKEYWVANDYPLTADVPDYPETTYEARGPFESVRAYKDDVDHAIDNGLPMVDVRSPEEFSGEVIAPEGLQETAQRGGHIPGASNVPIAETLNDDGTFKSPDELRALYEKAGVTGDESTITYCRVGERSSIEWFLLHELLGFDEVRNYDGSWTEWGNLVGAPVETGE
ncbi:MAG: sulfurtransferase [Halobacteriales archaeon]